MKSRIVKIIAIAVVILLLIVVVAVFFGGEDSSDSQTLAFKRTTFVDKSLSGESIELLNMLKNLENIKLDPTLFQDPAFMSLVDFSRPLAPQPQGRNNPFLPINPEETFGVSDESSASSTTDVTTDESDATTTPEGDQL